MASLNSVTIELQVQNEKEATAALKRFSAESERLSTSVLDSANKLKSITSRWDQANQMVKDGTLTVKAHKAAQTQLARELAVLNGMYKSNGALATQTAAAQLRAADAARREAAEIEAVTRARQQDMQRMRQIRNQYREGYAAFTQARQAMRDLREAMQRGSITADQYAARIAEVREGYKLMSAGGRGARRSMNDTGLAIQQVGYQVSDFAVQVQSGASPFVALGQQGAQLAGILPLVHKQLGLTMTAAIGLSAGLGIAIPLITALGNVLWTTSQQSEETADSIETLEDRLESLDRTLQNYLRTREAARAGITVEELLGLEGLEAAADRYRSEIEGIRDFFEAQLPGMEITDEFLRPLLAQSEEYTAALGGLIRAETRLGELRRRQGEEQFANFSERLTQYQEEIAMQREISRYGEDSAEVERLAREQALAAELRRIEAQRRSQEITDAQAVALTLQAEEAARLVAVNIENLRLEEERQAVMESMNSLARSLVTAYEALRDSAREMGDEFKDAQAEAADDLAAKIRETANAAADAAREAAELKREANEAKRAAEAIARADMQSGITAAANEAERMAAALGISLASATSIMLLGRNMPNLAAGEGGGPDQVIAATRESGTGLGAPLTGVVYRGRPYNPPDLASGRRGGGGGAAQQTAQDYLNQLFLEAQQRERLIGLSEEQRLREERRIEILNQAQNLQGTISQERINQLLDEEARIRELEQAEARRQDLMQVVQSNLESGLMALIDGSQNVEDAFRSMLRAILAEIAQQAIVKPIASGITSFLFSANGNAFSGGRVMPFANGGVVGGPTMFPMAGGRTGLMGEAGPEAIMPLKRTRGGKLGVAVEGGGSVVINQSFNFSANGDESVKRIIATEAPKIAALTERQIVDRRRRGGAMKSTFG